MANAYGIILESIKQKNIPEFSGLPDDQIFRSLFLNYRPAGRPGLRLSLVGLEILEKLFKSYEIEFSEKQIDPRYLIYMERFSKLPYFVTNEKIVCFDSQFAVRLQLSNGNINLFLQHDGLKPKDLTK